MHTQQQANSITIFCACNSLPINRYIIITAYTTIQYILFQIQKQKLNEGKKKKWFVCAKIT